MIRPNIRRIFSDNSCARFGNVKIYSFQTKNGENFRGIDIGIESKTWQMDYCHEVAHVLIAHLTDTKKYRYNFKYMLRIELTAWRLARSFCKEKYWNESVALNAFLEYIYKYPGGTTFVNMQKMKSLKIIPLNKGIRLPK